jgi:RNA polymerase sigma-70 factor, ECF subfamily
VRSVSPLVTTFGPIVYRWCRASGVRDADASDIVQEVFTAVARSVAKFEREKSEGSFRSWLATITRNKVRDYFRSQASRANAEGGTQALVELKMVPEDLDSTICAESAKTPLIRAVLQQVEVEFEELTWEAFWMATIDGEKAADIAAKLGISIASVYQSKSRVLRRLRARLSELPQ